MPHAEPPTPPDDDATLRLDHALKLAGVAATGGEAKVLIQGGAVRVNGSVETRRKRKLMEGDLVEVGDDTFEIALTDVEDDEADEEAAPGSGVDPAAGAPESRTLVERSHEEDPLPIRAPGAGDLEDHEDDEGGWDEDDEGDEEDDADDWNDDRVELTGAWNEDALRLDPDEMTRWTAWIAERVAADDVEAVIIRLGSLHPEALEAVFERLSPEVEARVLDGLDAVLEGASEDGSGGPGEAPLQA